MIAPDVLLACPLLHPREDGGLPPYVAPLACPFRVPGALFIVVICCFWWTDGPWGQGAEAGGCFDAYWMGHFYGTPYSITPLDVHTHFNHIERREAADMMALYP